MKTKFYFLTIFTFLTLTVSAQFPRFNTMLSEEWANNAWVNSMRSVNTYDANGNLINSLQQQFDAETQQWTDLFNIVYTPNTDGTVKETLSQVWEENAWQDFQKTVYTYSPTKKSLTETTQMNMEGTYMDWSKVTNTYNDKDSLETQLTQTIDFITMQMMNTDLDTYTYNANGTENQVLSQEWDPVTGAWQNLSRYTNMYNDAGKLTGDLTETWTDNAWVNEFKSIYTLNGDQLQESLEQEWQTDKWVDASKYTYTYTATNQLHQMISQRWNAENSQWVNEARYTFTYGSTGINPLTQQELVVFPNPFKDQITIRSAIKGEHGIEVFNASGQLVYSVKTPENNYKLDLGALNQGIYLIKTPQNNQSIKVLKIR